MFSVTVHFPNQFVIYFLHLDLIKNLTENITLTIKQKHGNILSHAEEAKNKDNDIMRNEKQTAMLNDTPEKVLTTWIPSINYAQPWDQD